jgi:hypothetical protein
VLITNDFKSINHYEGNQFKDSLLPSQSGIVDFLCKEAVDSTNNQFLGSLEDIHLDLIHIMLLYC